jgi:elongation factor P
LNNLIKLNLIKLDLNGGILMISAGDFKNGVTFEMDGSVFQIIEFQHVKPGKGAAFVRTKIKNVITGSIVERTFNPSDKMPKAQIDRREMQYLYSDGDLYHFMDTESYDQIAVNASTVAESLKFVKENDIVKILSFKENVFGIEAPTFVELEVTETDPGFKGDTATGATKPATVETGATVKVPLFVEQGDIIRIDTRIEEYMERVK